MGTQHDSSVQKVAIPHVSGERKTARVPDTLDMAERAEYALNALTRAVVPQRWYSVWQGMNLDSSPPYFSWPNWLSYKYLEAMPRMRQMSGSDLNLDVEQAMMQTFVDHIGKYGLLYYPAVSPDQPPNTSYALGCGRMMLAMAAWYERDGNSMWLDLLRDMAHGLEKMAIERWHYSYFPLESGFAPDGTWHFTQRGGGRAEFFPYTPPDEPAREQQGHEGTVKFEAGTVARALVRTYGLTGDERSLELAGRLVNFCLLPSMWQDGWEYGIAGHEHGLFAGHFHGNTMAIRGILAYAVAVGDERTKSIVREAYEHGRRAGLGRIGWVPGWITPERFGRIEGLGEWVKIISESCGIGNMAALAADLSTAGVGDYWEDVEQMARNQLVEQQFVDFDRMNAVVEHARKTKPKQDVIPGIEWDERSVQLGALDNVVERTVGAFSMGTVTHIPRVTGFGCCTGNGSLGLYYAWDAITRFRDGVAHVNLLLNRASPWMDIDSYLPFEGKVVLHNKQAETAYVHMPGWVSRGDVRCRVGSQIVQPVWVGRYLGVRGLKPEDDITVEFPVHESEDRYTVAYKEYTCHFRGSTMVDVSPRDGAPGTYPLYQRDHLKAEKAPVKQTERYVAVWPGD